MTPTAKQIIVNSIQGRIGCEHDWNRLTYAQLCIFYVALEKKEILDRIIELQETIIRIGESSQHLA